MWTLAKKLSAMGTLGINKRNAHYTLQYNPRHLYPLVDDKLRTKQLAERAGMAVPKLYGVIETQRQIKDLDSVLEPYQDFVVKPARGSGGNGILVFTGKSKHQYRRVDDMLVSQEELDYYCSNILSGIYSLGGHPDKAFIEYRVCSDPIFDGIKYQGLPDIRIIVFLGIPVMSMVRLPTRLSKGKANLHQGAIGVGIDMKTGHTLKGVWRNDILDEHPDTGNSVKGIAIPCWEDLLTLAAQCYQLTGLGYQGVDIVLDKHLGPLILEINARPGLNIQIANHEGLLPRLKLIEQHYTEIATVSERVAYAREN
ncbi:MAG: alpha-L-glutamate ligase-like protein, partial [Thermodesulfobacteriota bacterium]|nr:alpha-L-glutamate ligase-like protein [Thermodesulfobacteriota bacterium]